MLTRALAALAFTFALIALPTGCAINTDPILADGDNGLPGNVPDATPDRIAADSAFDAADAAPPMLTAVELTPYTGCDIDWACTDACAEDLDCPGDDGRRPAPNTYPPYADTAPDGAPHRVAPADTLWLYLGPIEAAEILTAEVTPDDPAANPTDIITLAVYAADDGRLLARSTTHTAVLLGATPADRVDALLRIEANPTAATLTLRREPVPAETIDPAADAE